MKSKIWQPRWWSENPERWRWAGTIALVFMLMGVFAYQNPHIWQNITPPQGAEEDTGANLPEPKAAQRGLSERQTNAIVQPSRTAPAQTATIAKDESADHQQEEMSATPAQTEQINRAEDTEPAGMQQLETAVAVNAAPAGWQQPGYGTWSRGYGYALDPTQGDYRFHTGCDMDLSAGSPVFAVAGGKVLLVAEDAAWGGLVIVEHGGGWRSIYKCVEPQINIGAVVAAGDQLGIILPSPPAEQGQSSHLHFEMELNTEKQDPAQWL